MTNIKEEIKKHKTIAMLAPSFASEFSYPEIVSQLKNLGFDKIVELTFGAKMVNREYHKILRNQKEKLWISSVCPGIVEFISKKYPKYAKNLIPVDSPMIATAKICKKFYPDYKICFISPCNFKKQEAEKSKFINYAIDYQQLRQILNEENIKPKKTKDKLDRFYNDYTKIYPLSGGLSKTAHLKGVLKKGEEKIIDGILEVEKFLEKPDKKIHFLDITFCKGGCIGGPFLSSKSLKEKRKKLKHYLCIAKKEKIPKGKEGIIKKARGIKFKK
jgi:iron only hydrogenase large subunit-like protein